MKSIFKKIIYIKEIQLVEPTIQYICSSSKECNWNALDLSEFDDKKPKKKVAKDKSEWKVSVDTVRIKNGTLRYKELSKDHVLDLLNLDVGVKNIKSDSNPKTLPTNVFLTADLGNTDGRVSIEGKANLFAKGLNFTAKSSVQDAPIEYFHSFYVRDVPFEIQKGVLNIDTNANCKKSNLNSNNKVSIYDLKVGGNPQGILVDEFLVNSKRQVALDVKVNGNLENGDIYFSTELTKGILKSILNTVKGLSPLRSVETSKKIVQKSLNLLFGKSKLLFKKGEKNKKSLNDNSSASTKDEE